MGLSYLRSNPLGGDGSLDGLADLSEADLSQDPAFSPSDAVPGPVDVSALTSPDLFARRPGLPPVPGSAPPAAPSPAAPPTFGAPGPQGLFPAQPKLPIAAPSDDPDDSAPSNDLLSRFAARLGSFGTSATPDDQKQALRQALIQGGLTMASNAGTSGLGALAPALLGGFATYRGGIEQAAAGRQQQAQQEAAADDAKARLAMEQGRYKQQADLQQQGIDAKADAIQAKKDQQQAKLDTHQKMLDVIQKSDPDLAAKLAPLAGSDTNAIETAYMASLKPEKPDKGPQLKEVASGSALYAVNPDGSYKLLVPAARVPGVNLGWDLVKQADGTLVRISKNTGEIAPVNLPPPATGSPAAMADERRKTAAGIFGAMNAAGTIPLGADGQPDVEGAYQKALDAADRVMTNRGGALPPGVTPPAPRPAPPVAPPKPVDSGPGFLTRLYNGITGVSSTPAPAAAPAAAPPPAAARPAPAQAQAMILTRLRQRMPGATEDQIQAALAKAMAAYGGQ